MKDSGANHGAAGHEQGSHPINIGPTVTPQTSSTGDQSGKKEDKRPPWKRPFRTTDGRNFTK